MKNQARLKEFVVRVLVITLSSLIVAINMNTFVAAGDLFPGGFTGISRLIQRCALEFGGVELPFAPLYLACNAIPAAISYKVVGKRFTLYSCLTIVLTSFFTDLVPAMSITEDVLLISIFGGIVNGFSGSLCLWVRVTSGGTDFIAIFFSEKFGIDTWNYIFFGNCVILAIAGYLFDWNEALYSIIFQFTSTQVLHLLYKRYQKQTLLIITSKPDEIYEEIREQTNHDATLFKGVGCYRKKECNMLYSVVGKDEIKSVTRKIHQIDPNAFINIMNTQQVTGRFYQRPND